MLCIGARNLAFRMDEANGHLKNAVQSTIKIRVIGLKSIGIDSVRQRFPILRLTYPPPFAYIGGAMWFVPTCSYRTILQSDTYLLDSSSIQFICSGVNNEASFIPRISWQTDLSMD